MSPDSRSSEQFIHGIKVLMARNYSQNLGEETIKGMRQKAKSGLYPSFAPAGYRNIEGPDGKRVIVPNFDAPVIARLFEEFATGDYSLEGLAAKARAEGWTIGGGRLHKSTLHQILRKRIYSGDFDWDGETYTGKHEGIVSRQTWEKVQAHLNRRGETKQHRIKHDFAYSGSSAAAIAAASCRRIEEAEVRLLPLHRQPGKMPTSRTRGRRFCTASLPAFCRNWSFRRPFSHGSVTPCSTPTGPSRRPARRLSRSCRLRHEQIDARIETMYMDKLDGRITQEFFDKQAALWRAEQNGLLRKIQDIEKATPAPVDQAIDMLRLTSRASDLFLSSRPPSNAGFFRWLLKRPLGRTGVANDAVRTVRNFAALEPGK